ncbi:MAG: PAS domain S-box protein, partial [Bacteroidota bacterium]|nr:PAS domain S-box protein [Bacteroidota bacterium]
YESDVNGNLTFVNESALELYGYSQAELDKGLNVMQVISPEYRDKAKVNFQNILHGKNSMNKESVALKKDGNTFPVQIYSTQIIKDIKPIGIRGIIIDITEQKQAEAEIKKHRGHLEELVEERTKELEEKNKKLKKYNKLFEGREVRIKELKDRVKELEERLGIS